MLLLWLIRVIIVDRESLEQIRDHFKEFRLKEYLESAP